MKRVIYTIVLVLIECGLISAQQLPIYNQHLVNKFSLNPAYAGYNQNSELFVGMKQSMVGIDGAPQSGFISGHGRIGRTNMGLGGTAVYETTGNFSTTYLDATYGYHVEVGRDNFLSLALSAEMFRNQFNYGGLLVSDAVLANTEGLRGTTVDANIGIMYSMDNKLNVGFTASRLIGMTLNYDNEIGSQYSLGRLLTFHASYLVELGRRGEMTLEPYMIARTDLAAPFNYEAGAMFNVKKMVWAAVGYRKGNVISLGFGASATERIVVNYTYDMGMGGIVGLSSGTHEISLGFLMKGTKVRRAPPSIFRPIQSEAELNIDELKEKLAATEKKLEKCCTETKTDEELEKRVTVLEERLRKVQDNAVVASVNQYEAPFIIKNIKFATNSDKLFSSSFPALNKLVEKLKNDLELEMKITGYTDNVGSPRYNVKLSERRAEAIKSYLVKEGVVATRIITEGKGQDNPIADNTTKAGRSKNRRIEGQFKRK